MNFNLIGRSLLDRRISMLIFSLGVAAYGLLMVIIWPAMSEDMATLEQLWESYPEGLKAAFGGEVSITSFDGYITLEYFSLMWFLIAVGYSISVTTSSLAGEIDKGTMELLLSQPVSRRSIAISKMIFHAVGLVVIIAATMIPLILGSMAIDEALSISGSAALSLLLFLFTMSFASIGFLFSSIFSDRGRAVFAITGVVIFSYALDLLAEFNNTIEKFHFLSLFKYFEPYPYLHDAAVNWGNLAIYGGVIVVASVAAVLWFKRRDIAV